MCFPSPTASVFFALLTRSKNVLCSTRGAASSASAAAELHTYMRIIADCAHPAESAVSGKNVNVNRFCRACVYIIKYEPSSHTRPLYIYIYTRKHTHNMTCREDLSTHPSRAPYTCSSQKLAPANYIRCDDARRVVIYIQYHGREWRCIYVYIYMCKYIC